MTTYLSFFSILPQFNAASLFLFLIAFIPYHSYGCPCMLTATLLEYVKSFSFIPSVPVYIWNIGKIG
ncbi:hypothetical protein T12_5923 [Trichinella patagoniensis]|uniref:Uncharacterized protein n=1 Tax=Trichinella patagoniensis TaxID=990121 RepID=A0A0V1ADM3_9BILA|nr:hypothetical protein T12_5923 [Trichinella patagoniensis]